MKKLNNEFNEFEMFDILNGFQCILLDKQFSSTDCWGREIYISINIGHVILLLDILFTVKLDWYIRNNVNKISIIK